MSKEGYLIKEGYNVKNWKKRWFILGKATLSYYSSQKSLKKVLGIIDLSEINEISQVHNKKKGLLPTNCHFKESLLRSRRQSRPFRRLEGWYRETVCYCSKEKH